MAGRKSSQIASENKRLKSRVSALRERLKSLNAGEDLPNINYRQQTATEKPDYTSLNTVFARCSYFARESGFLKLYLPLKTSTLNFGFEVVAVEDKDQDKLDKWLEEEAPAQVESIVDPQTGETITFEPTMTRREQMENLIQQVWASWTKFDNVVTLWRDVPNSVPTILDLTKCDYQNVLGIEILRYQHGLSDQQIKMLSAEDQTRFANATITLNVSNGEHFKVIRRDDSDTGFALPQLFSAFRLLGEVESKEVGMNAMGFSMRAVKRMHKLGHAIESGAHAGKATHFWNSKRDKAVRGKYVDKQGFEDMTVNFDHEVVYPWPDSKLFKAEYFESSKDRLMMWGGPLAWMFFSTGVNPHLSNLLRIEASAERKLIGKYLSWIISKGFALNYPVEIVWDDQIFNEAQLQAEMMKWAYKVGLSSAESGRKAAGLNKLEAKRKLADAENPDARKIFLPLWDDAHGIAPALGDTPQPAGGGKGKGPKADSRSGNKPGTKHKT